MARKIYYLNAWIVDANGAFHQYDGTPETIDSKNYSGDIDKTLQRAIGKRSHIIDEMCKVDTRQLQCVTLEDENGFKVAEPFVLGGLTDPDPNEVV